MPTAQNINSFISFMWQLKEPHEILFEIMLQMF